MDFGTVLASFLDHKPIQNHRKIDVGFCIKFLDGLGRVSGNLRRFESIQLENPGWVGEGRVRVQTLTQGMWNVDCGIWVGMWIVGCGAVVF